MNNPRGIKTVAIKRPALVKDTEQVVDGEITVLQRESFIPKKDRAPVVTSVPKTENSNNNNANPVLSREAKKIKKPKLNLKFIGFRVSLELYEKLHDFAHWNNLDVTRLLDPILDQFLNQYDIKPRPIDKLSVLSNKDPNFVGCRKKDNT